MYKKWFITFNCNVSEILVIITTRKTKRKMIHEY